MYIGIDLGGTKIELVALNANSDLLYKQRIPSPQGSYQNTLDALCKLVKKAEDELGEQCPVGVGIPGSIDRKTQLVKNANSTWLIGHPLQKDLSKALDRPIAIQNDADCFTLSEATDGAAKGYSSVFGVILGTGVGGGLCINQNLVHGPNGVTGEWGHNPMPWLDESEAVSPAACYCGKRGCIETYLSGPGFSAHATNIMREPNFSPELLQSKQALDGPYSDLCQTYARWLAKALSSVINILDPEVIVLGGGLSNLEWLYEEVPRHWSDYVFSSSVATQLRRARHGDSSGVRGAAWIARDVQAV